MTNQRPRALLGLAAVLALVTAFYLLSYRGILSEPGHIYQNWDQSIPPYPSQLNVYGSVSRDAWSSIFEMGSPGAFTGIGRAFDAVMRQGMASLGVPGLGHWYYLFYALVGATGFWRLGRRLGLGIWSSLAVCLLSQFNPRTYSMVVSGHAFEVGFALMLCPWMVDAAEGARRARGAGFWARALAAGLLAGLGFSTMPIGLVLTASFLALWALGAVVASRSARPSAVLTVAMILALSMQAHWIIPAATTGGDGVKYNLRLEDLRAHYQHVYKDFSAPPRQAMIGHTENLGMGTEQAYPVEGEFGRWWWVSAYALLGIALLGLLARSGSPALKAFAAACLLAGFWMVAGANTTPGRILYEGVLARVQMIFYLMARPMRWLPLYQAGLALLVGLGLQAVADRTIWRGRRWPEAAMAALALPALAVYLLPWWHGDLTRPKNETTQTLSLMAQRLIPEERQLVEALNRDPGLYRVSVFPTISSPTGDIPEPPPTSITRNYALLGKDSLVGPAFVGQTYGRFLLSLAHREYPATDAFGRLLGLGAVQRVFFDRAVSHLSYYDYGWMPQVKRGSETLSDPGGVLERFLAAQRDLRPDPEWSFGPILGLDNAGYLPRVRAATSAGLASGGMPLLASLAEIPGGGFKNRALFFATDIDPPGLERLGANRRGVTVLGESWPELLLPWLSPDSWKPALAGAAATPAGWMVPGDRWHQSLWLEGSPLNGASLWSKGPARLELPLNTGENGPYRVLVRVMSLPGQSGVSVRHKGALLVAGQPPSPMDRGWTWLDCGVLELPGDPLVVEAQGPGAIVSGMLVVPMREFESARASLDAAFPESGGTTVAVQAEAVAGPGAWPYAHIMAVPLLGGHPGLETSREGVRLDGADGVGSGTLAAEGEHVGQVLFRLELPLEVSGFTLECSPRLFGDPGGLAFVRAQWSPDGENWQPLFETPGATDGKWEDVYVRRARISVAARTSSVHLRFAMRQAQLNSLATPPNQPMRLLLEPACPFPGAASMGQAVLLPARFSATSFRPGRYDVKARLLTQDGPQWFDMGRRETDAQGVIDLSGGPPGTACDMFVLESQTQQEAPGRAQDPEAVGIDPSAGDQNPRQDGSLDVRRVNQARYEVSGQLPPGGLLLFSEAYNSRWMADAQPPLKAYGFMNAYVLPKAPPEKLDLVYSPERLRNVSNQVSLAVWGLGLLACLGCAVYAAFFTGRFSSDGKQGRDRPTP